MQRTVESRLADVFNREYQAHLPARPWVEVMRSVADAVALELYPEDPSARDRWREEANMSGLYGDSLVHEEEAPEMTPAEWHAYISGAPNFATSQDRMEEAVSAGVDFAELNACRVEPLPAEPAAATTYGVRHDGQAWRVLCDDRVMEGEAYPTFELASESARRFAADTCLQCGVPRATHPAGDGLSECPGDFGLDVGTRET